MGQQVAFEVAAPRVVGIALHRLTRDPSRFVEPPQVDQGPRLVPGAFGIAGALREALVEVLRQGNGALWITQCQTTKLLEQHALLLEGARGGPSLEGSVLDLSTKRGWLLKRCCVGLYCACFFRRSFPALDAPAWLLAGAPEDVDQDANSGPQRSESWHGQPAESLGEVSRRRHGCEKSGRSLRLMVRALA